MAVVQNGLLYSADPADSTIGDLFVIVNQDENVTVAGSAGPDIVEVSNFKEAITGYNITTADGGDTVDLQAGQTNDLVASNTFVNTNAGNDNLTFDSLLGGTVYAGAGTDRVNPSNTFFGTALVSTLIRLNEGDDFFNRTAAGASVDANIEGSTINGNAGIDELWFAGGYLTNNVIHGGEDQDTIDITIGAGDVFRGNTINGNRANDVINVAAIRNNANTNISSNTVFGGQGTDTINAAASTGNLYLSGDNGNDTVVGGGGADTIIGGEGADSLLGGDGNDFISGNADNDIISGDGGDDNIFGGNGRDTITTGTGRDTVTGNLGGDSIDITNGATTITDVVVQNNGDSVNASAVNAGVLWAAGNTVTYATTAAGNVDVITGFDSTAGAEDQLAIQGNLTAGVPASLIGTAVSGAGTAGNAYVVYGTYVNATGIFTMAAAFNAATAADALVVVGNNGALTINSNGFIVENLATALTDNNFA